MSAVQTHMNTETIRIDSLAYGGDGVGHLADGRVAFVPRGLPGDVCVVEYVDTGERFVRARLESIVEESFDRVQALCPEAASGRCGGCPWADLAYEAQLRWKRQAVVDALERIARMDARWVESHVPACIASKREWHYRNKVEFETGLDVAGRFTLGMHARGGSFTPLSSCALIPGKFSQAPKALTGALRFAAGQDDLGIERVGIRVSTRTNDVEVALWTSTGRFPRARVAQVVGESLATKGVGVTRVLLKGPAKERKVAGVESLRGHGYWTETVNGMTMLLSAPSFFQVNTPGAETLTRLVLDGLSPDGLDYVLDLYSGAGTFTLPLAREAHAVAAVESAGSSVRDLRRNLERNDLAAEVIGGDAARELASLGSPDKVVVDPPRSGLGDKAVRGLCESGARTIAYVSCNPTTLARDLVKLRAGGYEVECVTPVDMFPQTYHVETVAILTRTS